MVTGIDRSRVLVVDGERRVTELLKIALASQGYQVRIAAEGRSALTTFKAWRPQLVMTELCLPDMQGLDLCRRVRAQSSVPIIVLSGRGEERTKVEAFDAGADGYVTKPFSVEELLARVRAALRRSDGGADVASLSVGDFRLEIAELRVHVRGNDVRLTPKEFELFLYMARHPNRVLGRRALLEAVWGEAAREQSEYLRVFVGQLRKKLEPEPSCPRYLLTEPWVGYRFNPREQIV